MFKLFTILATFLFVFSLTFAQEQPVDRESRQKIREFEKEHFAKQQQYLAKTATFNQNQYDVTVYTLNLSLWPDIQLLEGSIIVEGRSLVNSLGNLEIDLLSNMTVDSIMHGGIPLNYTHSGDLIDLQLINLLNENDPFLVEIYYHGNPQGGGLGTWGWDTHQGVPLIWTLSQPYGAPAWWPCKDDPADKADSVFLNITVPDNLVVASNGLLMGITPQPNNRHTYSWEHHYPISTYLVSLAITDYAEFSNWYVSASGDSMELTYYVYPEQLTAAQEDFSVTPDMVAAFAALFGEYPFINEKYGTASFPWGGAMEHQTMTSYGAWLITGTHTFDWLNAHELAHQWFGDCITMKYWSHIWMNEGFASYSEALWAEHNGGWPAYHNYMLSQDPGSFQGSLWIEDSLNVNALFGNTVYDKGSWTLHMLRGVLGDAVFFDALHDYATNPNFHYGNAKTEDFQVVCETISGQNLEWFFEEWVYRPGRPNYVYSWEATGSGSSYTTTLALTQSNALPYKMPLQIRLSGSGSTADFTVWDSLNFQSFEFTTTFEPTGLQVDPDNWVLKNISGGILYSVGGTVVNVVNGTGIAEAMVIWEGPIDPVTGTAYSYGIDTTDANGNFQFNLVSGDYAFVAIKDSYLDSKTIFRNVNGAISNLSLSLSQPEAAFSLDSLGIALYQNQVSETLMVVSNTGSGDMFVQAAAGDYTTAAAKLERIPLLHHQFPLKDLRKSGSIPQNTTLDPVDSLWMQIHHDGRENPQNLFDIENTYIQENDGVIYFKITTYGPPVPPGNFRSNLFLDTDNNTATGIYISGIGVDYLIALGDFGAGLYGYLLVWNPVSEDFDLLGPVDYFSHNSSGKYVIAGVQKAGLGNPAKLGIFYNAFNTTNITPTVDYVPASNLGYLSAAPEAVPWLKIEPLYGLATTESDTALAIIIQPENMVSGTYTSGITLYTSHAGEMRKDFIPVHLDYSTGIVSSDPVIPTKFEASQNYPNPFNPNTKIKFALPSPAKVKIEIFNLLGQRVYFEETQQLPAGYHLFEWNGQSTAGQEVSSGIYFYKISDGKHAAVRKMILLR